MNKDYIIEIVRQAYDMHVHVGPEVIPRKFTASSLTTVENGNIAGCVLKNHFYATTPLIETSRKRNLDLIGGIVLNNAVGGLNVYAIYAASLITKNPLVVWLPTINSERFLRSNKYEIAPEWVHDKSLKLKSASIAKPVRVTKDGKLLNKTKRVIKMINQIGGILATGHIAPFESYLTAKYARSLNVPVIITHPIYQHIQMPESQQKELAGIGCFIEQSYSMYSMDNIAINKIASEIKSVGAKSVILTSDVGQDFSPSPSKALIEFSILLNKQGIPLNDIYTMLVVNPRILLNKPGINLEQTQN